MFTRAFYRCLFKEQRTICDSFETAKNSVHYKEYNRRTGFYEFERDKFILMTKDIREIHDCMDWPLKDGETKDLRNESFSPIFDLP